jgi:hypothetical protein
VTVVNDAIFVGSGGAVNRTQCSFPLLSNTSLADDHLCFAFAATNTRQNPNSTRDAYGVPSLACDFKLNCSARTVPLASALTAFAPLFATSLQRMEAGGDDPKVQQLTAAAVTIVIIVQALSQFLGGQGRALIAWRHTFFPAAVAQMFSSPWREGRIYGKLLLWLLVARPLLAQAGAVLLFFAVQLWVTAVPLQVAGAWLVIAVVALAGSALALWFDLLLLGLSGHLRGHLVWAQTRLQAAEAGSTEPLFAPPQVGWFIPEPNAAELHRFGYDQILLKRAEPPPLPKPEVVAQQPDASSNEMPEATLGQPEAALSQVEPVEHPPQPEPRRLADLAPAATVWRAPSGVREQRWEPPTGRSTPTGR